MNPIKWWKLRRLRREGKKGEKDKLKEDNSRMLLKQEVILKGKFIKDEERRMEELLKHRLEKADKIEKEIIEIERKPEDKKTEPKESELAKLLEDNGIIKLFKKNFSSLSFI